MSYTFTRQDNDFYSRGTRCGAWLYLPDCDEKCPVIVMAHGLGATRELRLWEYAERFAAAGYACFLFDYRNYGSSDGNKRQLINVRMQLEDWNNAIDFIRGDKRVDGSRLLVFGSSFSGGHSIWLSAHRKDISAAIAQCPYTDTIATIGTRTPKYILQKVPLVVADWITCLSGYNPVMVKLSTFSGENAFMEADEETTNRFLENAEFINEAPARTLVEFVKYSPGMFFGKINNPVYTCVCKKDNLAPAKKTIKLLKKSPKASYKEYDCGHFEIYLRPYFDEVIEDDITFFNTVLGR